MAKRWSSRGVPLARCLSRCGVLSRSEASAAIRAGRVTVDRRLVTDPQQPVLADAVIYLDGKCLSLSRSTRRVLAYHKPRGEISSVKADPRWPETPCIGDRFRDQPGRLFPCGRLDRDSEGLILVTDDNELADRVTRPGVLEKEYMVTLDGLLPGGTLESLSRGVTMATGEFLRPRRVEHLRRPDGSIDPRRLIFVLDEGRNREIRRLIHAVGGRVRRLVRRRIGPIRLGDLAAGTWRELDPSELRQLDGAGY